jgi:hypothetical protein
MAFARLPINTLSGGVGRQAPTKRLTSEAENIDNCLVTLEKSVEKRPPLVQVSTNTGSSYLDVANVEVPVGLNFNTDNLYFHFLDIDGYNRYCIIINRAGYTFDPVVQQSFTYNGQTINLSNFITVYRIEPTQWVKETVDDSAGYQNNTSGFNRGIFEYLTYANKNNTTSYKLAGQTVANIAPSSIKDTFGSIDFDVGLILWNKQVDLDYLTDNSGQENGFTQAQWLGSLDTNEYIHSGDVINYKISTPPSTPVPNLEDSLDPQLISNYWINVRDDVDFTVDPDTLEEEEIGQNLENFASIPQYPASEVYNDVRDSNGFKAWRMLHHYYDKPRLIPLPQNNLIDFSKDHYYLSSPLTTEERDGQTSYLGLGKVYFVRNPYLTFPTGFYRATRYSKNPYFERLRSEGPGSVFDHRRFPVIIYKDFNDQGKWKIRHMPLFPRRAGTSLSNPGPKALERKEKIQSMAVWKSRLWVATENTIFASRTNSFYNFWVDDINNITETDPIDIQASVGAYNKLSYIVPFQNLLFALSSGSVQFEVRGGSTDVGISPFNVEFRPTSFFSTSKVVAPLKMGNNVFFMNAGKLYMYLSGSSVSDEFSTSMDISHHCRDYIPQNIGATTVSSAVNTLFAVDASSQNYLYQFTFRTNGDKIAQNAFHRWILSTDDRIKAMQCYEKDMYIISSRPTGASPLNLPRKLCVYFVSLETVPYTTPMIDWLVTVTAEAQLVGPKTKFILPYYDPEVKYVVLTDSAWGSERYKALTIAGGDISYNVGTNRTEVLVPGDYRNNTVSIGRSYQMNIELSQQVYRSSQDTNTVLEGVLNLKKITTRHLYSGSYDIVVERRGRLDSPVTFYPLDTNSIIDQLAQLKIDRVGEHLVKVLSYSENCKIFIRSSYPTPCNISNIEIVGNFRSLNTSIE